jgi:uncharacterized protein (DUF927 family)
MSEADKQAAAGLDVRLVNLPADAGAGMGVFQELHGRPNPATLAEELQNAGRAHHGTASRAFLARLAEDRAVNGAELSAILNELRERFLAVHVPAGAAAQVRSVARRFALIAVAGELARDYGVLRWPEGEASRAAGACFEAWLADRGGVGTGEDARALAQVRAFLEAHGESRFTLLVPPPGGGEAAPLDSRTTSNRAGWRRRLGGADGGWEYLVLPEAWRKDVCKGLNAKRTADLLYERGLLLGATPRDRSDTRTIPGEGKRRVYRVSGAILADETIEGDTGDAR